MSLEEISRRAIAEGWTDLQEVSNWIWGYPPEGAGAIPVPYPRPVNEAHSESPSIRAPLWEHPAFLVPHEVPTQELFGAGLAESALAGYLMQREPSYRAMAEEALQRRRRMLEEFRRMPPRQRYLHDPEFRIYVDGMVSLIRQGFMDVSDAHVAVDMATEIVERNMRDRMGRVEVSGTFMEARIEIRPGDRLELPVLVVADSPEQYKWFLREYGLNRNHFVHVWQVKDFQGRQGNYVFLIGDLQENRHLVSNALAQGFPVFEQGDRFGEWRALRDRP